METTTSLELCSNPGCSEPGIMQCSACKTSVYCGPICQTAHWPHHKEECSGHLRKVGMAYLAKAKGFERDRNCPQILRYSLLALSKLQQVKNCAVEDISSAMRLKFNALNYLGRHSEALECAKEWYCLYPTNHTHPPAIDASFCLIHSCINNNKFFDAALYARTLWETINDKTSNNHIPENERPPYIAHGAKTLAGDLFFPSFSFPSLPDVIYPLTNTFAEATLALAESGGFSVGEKQRAGIDAISFARKALEVHTQLYGAESEDAAIDMGILASILDYFQDVDDDETVELYQRSTAITARLQGRMSPNTAAGELNLGSTYQNRARRAHHVNAYDREITNLELSLPHYVEAARIYRNINRMDKSEKATRAAKNVEEWMERTIARRDAAATISTEG